MSNLAQVRDGRESLAFLLDKFETATSLVKGDIAFITGVGTTFAKFKVGEPYIATKDTETLTGNDKCKKATPLFLGFAKSKSLEKSKNVVDVTIDYDSATNNITDGTVTKSGSISGANVTEMIGTDSAINKIKSRFDRIAEYSGTAVDVLDSDTTDKDMLMIIWNGRNAKSGDMLEIEFVPALFTSVSTGGDYGSSQNFDVNFTGNASDENGFLGMIVHVPFDNFKMPSIVRPIDAE